MRTLALCVGPGRLHLLPAAAADLTVAGADAEPPLRHETPERLTLSAPSQTRFGFSVPPSVQWTLHVPATFDRLLVQSAGATVISEALSWVDVRLEGATSRFECRASRLGTLSLVGTAQQAAIWVDRLDQLSLDGLNNRATLVHAVAFTLERHDHGLACQVTAPAAQTGAAHRLRCQLSGVRQVVEIQHAPA
jgi:hypothetical protein